jgi:hypothetical protein
VQPIFERFASSAGGVMQKQFVKGLFDTDK